jgi:TctA family transporter
MAADDPEEPKSWLDMGTVRKISDIALGILAMAAGIFMIANIGDASFIRPDGISEWAFPAAIAGLLLMAGLILVARGGFLRTHQPERWSIKALIIIAAGIAAAVFALPQGGSNLALTFGPADYTALIISVLVVAIALARASRLRAVAMVLLGLSLATVGVDVATGIPRFTFGSEILADGIPAPVVWLGLLVVADGVLCLLSPDLFLAIYARQVAGWTGPRISKIAALGMRIAAVLAITAAGAYAFRFNNQFAEVGGLAAFGVFGLACRLLDWNRLVLILGFNYGILLEENIRRAMLISRGDLLVFAKSPVSAALLLIACGTTAAIIIVTARHSLFRKRAAI